MPSGAEATPPASLPNSPAPGSPEALKGKGRMLEEIKGRNKKSKLGGSGRIRADMEALRGAREDDPTSPILPKVRLAFPKIMSDEEDEGPWSSGSRSGNGGSQAGGASAASSGSRPRTWSKTTTTRRTEHRSFRYSMPAFEHLYNDDVANSNGSSSSGSRGANSPRHSPSLSTSSIPFPQNASSRRPTHSTSSATNVRPTRTSLPSRRPATSFGSSSSASNRFDRLFDPSTLPSRHYNSTDPYTFSEPALQPLRDPPPLVTTLTTTTLPFIKPFLHLFFLLVISAIAACSISAVLVTGFGLTFVDDCGRRVASLREGFGVSQKRMRMSIEGVRAGMGRMLGGAREALDLAVWATGARARSEGEDPATTSGDDLSKGSRGGRGRSKLRRRTSCSPGVGNRFEGGAEASSKFDRRSLPANQENGWTSSDDEPYHVPPPTPRTSPATPARSPSPPSTRSLPPRPPLRTLVPSLLFVLAYTFYKVVSALWTGRADPPKARRRP